MQAIDVDTICQQHVQYLHDSSSSLAVDVSFQFVDLQFKKKTKQQIFINFVISVIFWADACTTQYEFIVVNDQITTSAFHKVV